MIPPPPHRLACYIETVIGQYILVVLLQFVVSCLFVAALLVPAGRLLGQGRLDFRRSLQCGLGFALFQLTSVLLFSASISVMRNPLNSPEMLHLALVWVSLPLLLIAPVMISFTTGWKRGSSITSSTVITLCWAGVQYGVGNLLLRLG